MVPKPHLEPLTMLTTQTRPRPRHRGGAFDLKISEGISTATSTVKHSLVEVPSLRDQGWLIDLGLQAAGHSTS